MDYTISARHPGKRPGPHSFEFTKPSREWQFIGETISAVGSELYPWDPAVVAAIREFEPDFMPLWIVSAYLSPAGSVHKFGRHAIAFSASHHAQEGPHRDVKVWPSCWGINAGRKVVTIASILQDKSVRVVPELSVYGYRPLDWSVYNEAKRSWWETKRGQNTHTAEGDAAEYVRDYFDAQTQMQAKAQAEADYVFDHETNKGRKIKDEFNAMTAADWNQLGRQQPERKPFVILKGNA